jgi:flagellin
VGGNIDSGDVFSMVIDGKTVTATIATTDGFADTPNGAANQIAQAITTADLDGVKATYNSNTATFTLEKSGSLSVASTAAAQLSVEFIDAAIQKVNSQRADLGSISNRLDSTVSNLTNISSNLSAGRGRIEDADFAAETTNLAKTQILQQASTAMLAQANASKQGVLSLLQGSNVSRFRNYFSYVKT